MLVIGLSLALIFGIVQLAVALHVRNTLIDAAAEGARYAALADTPVDAGATRTAELIRAALGSDYAERIEASFEGNMTRVRVIAHIPLFGFLGAPRTLEVSGHAIRESMG